MGLPGNKFAASRINLASRGPSKRTSLQENILLKLNTHTGLNTAQGTTGRKKTTEHSQWKDASLKEN